jgi:hypothetical protein
LIILGITATVSTATAVSVGGATVIDRLFSLVEDDPYTVYMQNRGFFVRHAFTVLLPTFPMGAGLGRTGMMSYYFGDDSIPGSSFIWSEVQIPAWIVDGGLPLLVAYALCWLIACWTSLRIGLDRSAGFVSVYALATLALNIGITAQCFSYSPFSSQWGMQAWALNAAVFAGYQLTKRRQPGGAVKLAGST